MEELIGEKCGYSYTEAYTVSSQEGQDRMAIQSFEDTADSGYNLFTNNCADAVFKAVSAAGFDIPLGDYYYFETGITSAKSLQQSVQPLRIMGRVQEKFVRFIDRRKMAIPTIVFDNFRRKYPNGNYRTHNSR